MKKSRIAIFVLLSLLLSGCLTLGDYVWLDANANGAQDASEMGVEGVTVNLYDSDNALVASTTSDSLGAYQFQGNFGYSNYRIEFELPPGYQFTQKDAGPDDLSDSDADPATGLTPAIVFSAPSVRDQDFTLDAGLVPEESAEIQQEPAESVEAAASIGDFVWHDDNMNGIQDEDEIGFEGVQVTLLAADGSQVASTSSDADGFYSFDELVPGEQYSLQFAAPETYMLSPQDEGDDDDGDSDPDPDTGETALYTASEDGDQSVDAGLFLPSSAAASVCYGPGGEPFPEGVSPLTGLPVDNVELLSLNPVFVSISIFPPSVRPPTGLASAPLINQLYIGDGDTRLLTTFYGEFPQPVLDGDGGAGESEPPGSDLDEGEYIIGNRVWFDSNGNHLQDEGEPGLPNVPVRLVDINFNTVASTTTDGGGYYYFVLTDVEINTEFQVRVGAPPTIPDYYFVNKDVGSDDTIDSDVTKLGRSDFFDPTDNESQVFLDVDAGIRQAYIIQGLRSGRTAYQDIQTNYCGCIVSAGADPTVAAQINTCANAFGDSGDIGGAGLDVTRLQGVAEASTENSFCTPNLTEANLICTDAPEQGGQPANELYVQYNINNISHFVYDESAGAYLWYLSVPGSADPNNFNLEDVEFELMTDGLTGETLTFENVVVMNVNHVAQNAAVTIIDLDMAFQSGPAFVLRNGQIFEATWSTTYPDYVTNTDQPLPVHFQLGEDPFPLAPGQVWINLMNEFDTMDMIGSGIWLADFDAPAYTP